MQEYPLFHTRTLYSDSRDSLLSENTDQCCKPLTEGGFPVGLFNENQLNNLLWLNREGYTHTQNSAGPWGEPDKFCTMRTHFRSKSLIANFLVKDLSALSPENTLLFLFSLSEVHSIFIWKI